MEKLNINDFEKKLETIQKLIFAKHYISAVIYFLCGFICMIFSLFINELSSMFILFMISFYIVAIMSTIANSINYFFEYSEKTFILKNLFNVNNMKEESIEEEKK